MDRRATYLRTPMSFRAITLEARKANLYLVTLGAQPDPTAGRAAASVKSDCEFCGTESRFGAVREHGSAAAVHLIYRLAVGVRTRSTARRVIRRAAATSSASYVRKLVRE